MEIREEYREEFINTSIPSINEIISSNNKLNQNQVSNNQSSTIESYNPQNQNNYSYSKTDLGDNDITNIKMEEKENIDEETEETVRITNRIIKAGNSSTYEKKVISKIITKEGPNDTTIIKTSNILNENSSVQNHNKATYTRPLPKNRQKNNNNNQSNKIKIRNILPKTNKNNSNINNTKKINLKNAKNLINNKLYQTSRNKDPSPNNLLISSQSFVGNKLYLNKEEISNNAPRTHRSHSPDPNSIRRKTITRGNEVKNVQITHIICSKKPADFHISEKLDLHNIKSNPIQINKTDKEKLKKGGKSSYSSSCQDNIKPIVQNLKGKTTIYQHARGIGMTNDRRGNINPLFYNSEIKKLEPIIKEKEKEKVVYIENFRSNKYRNGNANLINSTRNLDSNNNFQYKNYNTVANSNRIGVNSVRINLDSNK